MNKIQSSIGQHLTHWFMRRTSSCGVRRIAAFMAAVASDVGVVRDQNQDRVALMRACDKSGKSFVVVALADGMGGCETVTIVHLWP